MLFRALFPPEEEVVETSSEPIFREETDEEKKYSVKIYKYVPSVEEITILKDKGYTKEEIEAFTDDELIRILYGKEAVESGLIDKLGGLKDALAALHKMIGKRENGKNCMK